MKWVISIGGKLKVKLCPCTSCIKWRYVSTHSQPIWRVSFTPRQNLGGLRNWSGHFVEENWHVATGNRHTIPHIFTSTRCTSLVLLLRHPDSQFQVLFCFKHQYFTELLSCVGINCSSSNTHACSYIGDVLIIFCLPFFLRICVFGRSYVRESILNICSPNYFCAVKYTCPN
jgi:hypothetical protein